MPCAAKAGANRQRRQSDTTGVKTAGAARWRQRSAHEHLRGMWVLGGVPMGIGRFSGTDPGAPNVADLGFTHLRTDAINEHPFTAHGIPTHRLVHPLPTYGSMTSFRFL
jgi:hypothetical protein